MAGGLSAVVTLLLSRLVTIGASIRQGKPVPYRRTRIGSVGTREEVAGVDAESVQELATSMGYEAEGDSWCRKTGVLSPFIEWSVEFENTDSDQQQWVLVETIALPAHWVWILIGGNLLALVWIYLPFPMGWWIVAVGASLSWTVLFIFIESPLDKYIDRVRSADDSDTVLTPQDYKTACSGPAITAVAGGFFSSGPVFLTGLPLLYDAITSSQYVTLSIIDEWLAVLILGALWMGSFWIAGLVAGLLIYIYEDSDVKMRIFPFDLVSRVNLPIPELSGGYLTLLVAASLPVAALTGSSFFLPILNHLNSTSRRLYFLTPPSFIAVSLFAFLYWWVIRNRKYVYDRTIAQLASRQTRVAKLRTLGIITIVSYALAFLLIAYIDKFQAYLYWPLVNTNPTPIVRSPLTVVLLIGAVLPLGYFIIGIGYQLLSVLAIFYETVVLSRPIGKSDHVGATVRVFDDADPQAFAVGVGSWKTIVISTGMLSLFETEEAEFATGTVDDSLTALLAHEEAHLDPNANEYWLTDAAVSLLAPLCGVLTLSGKNVIYALLDFRHRESKADQYAALKTDPNDLVTALQKVGDATGHRGVTSSIPFLPSVVSTGFVRATSGNSFEQKFHRFFGLLFGSFALARAHPDIDDRIDALESES